ASRFIVVLFRYASLVLSTSHVIAVPVAFFFLLLLPPPTSTLFPYTTLFRSLRDVRPARVVQSEQPGCLVEGLAGGVVDDIELLRSEEHTSELQSRFDLVCRLLLEKKKRMNGGSETRTRASSISRRSLAERRE